MRRTFATVIFILCFTGPLTGHAEDGVFAVASVATGDPLPSEVRAEAPSIHSDFEFTPRWEGRTLEPQPNVGLRVMHPLGATRWSAGVEFNRLDVAHTPETHADIIEQSPGTRVLAARAAPVPQQAVDGLNILTANGERALFTRGPVSAHAGLGIGVAVPEDAAQGQTRDAALETGPAARWYLGASVDLMADVSAFAEYNGTYSTTASDALSGSNPDTDVLNNALNIGIGFSF